MWKTIKAFLSGSVDVVKSMGYHSYLFAYGVMDGCRVDRPIRLLMSKPDTEEDKLHQTTLKSKLNKNLMINGAILFGSTAAFEFAALPMIVAFTTPLSWIPLIADISFDVLWFVPAYAMCFMASNAIYNDISQAYFEKGEHHTVVKIDDKALNPQEKTVEEVRRYGMLLPLMGASGALFYLPVVGPGLSFASSSFVTSFYANEYKWNQKGMELDSQSKTMDRNYAYFIGQGALLTALSFFCPPTVGMSIMLAGFPLLLINARHRSFEQRLEMFERAKPDNLYFSNLPLFQSANYISNLVFGRSARWIQNTYSWLKGRPIPLYPELLSATTQAMKSSHHFSPPELVQPLDELKYDAKGPMLFMGPKVGEEYPMETVVEKPQPTVECPELIKQAILKEETSIMPMACGNLINTKSQI